MKAAFLLLFVLFSSSSLGGAEEEGEKPYKYEWLDWKPGLFESHREKGRIVWLSFTADWWLVCKTNVSRVFSDKKVLKELEKYRVVLICADLTKRNAKIVAEMKKFDLENVPANLIGAADPKAKVILMPEILRADDAIKLLQKAAKQRVR